MVIRQHAHQRRKMCQQGAQPEPEAAAEQAAAEQAARRVRRRLSKPFAKREAARLEKTCPHSTDDEAPSGNTGQRRMRHTLSRPFWSKQISAKDGRARAGHTSPARSVSPARRDLARAGPRAFAGGAVSEGRAGSMGESMINVQGSFSAESTATADGAKSPIHRSQSTPEVRAVRSPQRSVQRSTPFWELKERQRRKEEGRDGPQQAALPPAGAKEAAETSPRPLMETLEELSLEVSGSLPQTPSAEEQAAGAATPECVTATGAPAAAAAAGAGASYSLRGAGHTNAAPATNDAPAVLGLSVLPTSSRRRTGLPAGSPTSSGFAQPTTPVLAETHRAALYNHEATSPAAFAAEAGAAAESDETEQAAAVPEGGAGAGSAAAGPSADTAGSESAVSAAGGGVRLGLAAGAAVEEPAALDVHELISRFETMSHESEAQSPWQGAWPASPLYRPGQKASRAMEAGGGGWLARLTAALRCI